LWEGGLVLIMKKSLLTGITGQDGSYLAEILLEKGYEVHGIIRRSSSFNTGRIDHIINNEKYKDRFFFHHGDVTDASNLSRLLEKIEPDEIYNLAAQKPCSGVLRNPRLHCPGGRSWYSSFSRCHQGNAH